ncbi:MAG: hypothetical protein CLLPBCKN_005441 [Chroococcidiopsis cubana SAG 39.79]|jgi:hypothetical protein|uniref:Uncharacterized protein n=1 Tax=Chroococcidiopsis cubana SAG 39.79 TaxID=388085 RepID=A0AB37UM50_9CYAN|nr:MULTISPECIES: hypothetical protein [Chroococcidiopsis]OWY67627.1 hypothetical protein B7486_30345 [cyanobacterium TDX16]MBD2309804.1 hypothetical protein [Chroococcidiopsis sp. [FACHB-1243]]MDV2995383.1 hypothetical protein [Chroococcidiopsis sp. SAG 2025]MDZ4876021.1 hypothetical protein [Chroococcidiopsis cubana SAG 39.79]PSB60936.1 hypothetical protein C7B79_23895 [Chroococcidiopsis cubana CCALA 043]
MSEARSKEKVTRNDEMDTSTADRGIIPAEVAARMDREGEDYRETAEEQAGAESLNVTGGATVDQEGLANNYAVEPEMYYETPGDRTAIKEAEEAERQQTVEALDEDEQGKLTEEGDQRHKGPGII